MAEEADEQLGAAAVAAAAAAGRAADAERALGAAQHRAEAVLGARGTLEERFAAAKEHVAVRAFVLLLACHLVSSVLPCASWPPRRRCPLGALPGCQRAHGFACLHLAAGSVSCVVCVAVCCTSTSC